MTLNFANQVTAQPATLVGQIGIGDTAMQVSTTVNYPSAFPYEVTLQDTAESTPEIVTVTGTTGANILTIVRGQGNTPPSAHAAGAIAQHGLTAEALSSIGSTGASTTPGSMGLTWPPGQQFMGVSATAASGYIIDPTAMKIFNFYCLADEGLNAATFNTSLSVASGTIKNGTSVSSVSLTINGQAIIFYSNGTNLQIVG